ncbi:DUF7344 domain-containing protein [Haladaptatus salinisoli]|uniref:DUF7344 domain-containing protein n=1 Tax=Haladaptatus salinisoli TaxID=2884876 RepID=UPI001D0A2C64|nr:hypothetical protein [Haladaptatus salinisoli]
MSAVEDQYNDVEKAVTTDDKEEESIDHELSKDKIFHLLQTPRRRGVLRYLKENDGPVEMRDLAEQVAAWENNTTLQALTSDERQRVYIALYQSHLPKLDKEGIIRYDQNRGTVVRTELANRLDCYLNVSATDSPDSHDEDSTATRWEVYYLGASVLGTIILGGSELGVPLLVTLPAVAIGGGIVALFLLVTLAQFFFH